MRRQNTFCIMMVGVFISTGTFTYSQNPLVKIWDYRYGGNKDDRLTKFIATSDNGFLLIGYSESGISGDKTQGSWGGYDFWVVKIDSEGNKQWDKDYGSFAKDLAEAVDETADGGYIIGGISESNIGGNKTQNTWGYTDFWMIKTDSLGNLEWDKDFGGTDEEEAYSIQQSKDGGYLIGGYSRSQASGDKTQSAWGETDYWILKTDSLGVKQWDKNFGYTDLDWCFNVQQTMDEGYLVAGHSISEAGGEKTQNGWGHYDCWIIKIDSLGQTLWDKDFGGTSYDYLYHLQQTEDHGYIIGGMSGSDSSGDKTNFSWGSIDYWLVKMDSLGNIEWDKDFGGTGSDVANRVQTTADNGYLISGISYSDSSGNKTESNLGNAQTWVVKTDSAGNLEWEKTFLTEGDDYFGSAIELEGRCYIIACYTDGGIGGDKTQASWGGDDYWVIKLCDSTGLSNPHSSFISNSNAGCPNSCFDFTNTSSGATSYQWSFSGGYPSTSTQANVSGVCYSNPGSYEVSLIASTTFGADTNIFLDYIVIYTPLEVSISQYGNMLTCNPAAAIYQWLFNGNPISGATSQSLYVVNEGTYSVEVIDSNGCIASDTIEVELTGIDDELPGIHYSIEPNPNSGLFTIHIHSIKPVNNIDIELIDLLGRTLYSESVRPVPFNFAGSISMKELPEGNYFLRIKSGQESAVHIITYSR